MAAVSVKGLFPTFTKASLLSTPLRHAFSGMSLKSFNRLAAAVFIGSKTLLLIIKHYSTTRFSRRLWGRNAWRTSKKVCVGGYIWTRPQVLKKLCNISNIHWDSNVFTMILSRNKCLTYLLLIPSIRDDTLFVNVDSIHRNTQLLYQSFVSWFNSVRNLQYDLRFKRITCNN